MRSVKLATLLLLAGSLSFACNSDDGDGGDSSVSGGDGDGDGTSTGTTTGTSTGTTTGSTTGTTTGDTMAGGCDNVVASTGVPALIDDFDHGASWNFSDDSDGRVGTWEHEYAVDAAGGRQLTDLECGDSCDNAGMGGGGDLTPGYLVAKCDGEEWCAGGAYGEDAWGNWAAVSTPLAAWSETDVNCYDASTFTGIEFKAWSSLGTKVRLQVIDPNADSEAGITYQSPVITLPATKPDEPQQIAFADMKIPDWVMGQGGDAVNPAALRSLSFAVRSLSPESDDMGERIAAYEVNLDDVAFYK